jgi:hypothetical protein
VTIEIPEWMSKGLTAAEYETLPEDIRRRIEVIDGAVLVRPSPDRAHQEVVQVLASALRAAAQATVAGDQYVEELSRNAPQRSSPGMG